VTASIEVAWVDLDPGASEVRALARLLSDDERARVATRATSALRRRATVSLARRRVLAADVLATTPSAVELRVLPDGRRAAVGPRSGPIAISVATSADTGLVAVASSGSVGVDVEDFAGRPSTDEFVARVASPAERTQLESRDDRDRALLALWTRKEAYLKAIGEGIGANLRRVEVPLDAGAWALRWRPADGATWYLFDLDCPRPGLAAAVVAGPATTSEDLPTLRVRPG
jgi:4'-phosphopantetheinyl transferase